MMSPGPGPSPCFRMLGIVLWALLSALPAIAQGGIQVQSTTVQQQSNNSPRGQVESAVVQSIQPAQGTQGQTLQVTFTANNLSSLVTLTFQPAAGISASGIRVTSPHQLIATVAIAAGATPGPRQVRVNSPDGRTLAQFIFNVTAAPTVGVSRELPEPTILRLTPNQVNAGAQNVEIRIEGRNFAPGAQVNFSGTGIFALGLPEYRDSTELRVKVNVLSTALPGPRDVTVRNTNRTSGTAQRMLNVLLAVKKPPVISKKKEQPKPKLPPISPDTTFVEGVINLTAPEWGKNGQSGEIITDRGVPLVDDDLVFKWKEQNPGTADVYELRIFVRNAKQPIVTQRIEGTVVNWQGMKLRLVPTYFRPDSTFLADLLNKAPNSHNGSSRESNNKQAIGGPEANFTGTTSGTNTPSTTGGSSKDDGTMLSDGDLQWQVVGLRQFDKSGVKTQPGSPPANPVELEVEVSDRWPLGTPARPTGLACGSGGMTQGGLQVVNVSKKAGNDPNSYPGDRFVLVGKISLKDSPYAAHPHEIKDTSDPNQVMPSVLEFQFNNLFVDWGDGTIEPLNLPASSNSLGWSRSQVMELPGANAADPPPATHQYSWTGTYTIRVFQVSDEDLQKVSASQLALTVDGPSQSPYMLLTQMSSAGSKAQGGAQPGVGRLNMTVQGYSPSNIANRAYMIFCGTKTITNREDLAASGPLHLVSVKITGFPGHDVQKSGRNMQAVRPGTASNNAPASQVAARASSCDEALQADGELSYYGTGKARLRWILDAVVIGETELPGLSSEQRKNLGPDPAKWGTPRKSVAYFKSPQLDCRKLGLRKVFVEAEVVPEPSAMNLTQSVLGLISTASGQNKQPEETAIAGAVLSALGKNPLKVGILSPNKVAAKGMPAFSQIDPKSPVPGLQTGLVMKAPPLFVSSEVRTYQVNESDPNVPCVFVFATTGGDFRVSDFQGTLKKTGESYSGEGVLQVKFVDGSPNGASKYDVPVSFQNWSVPDGEHVATGSLSVSPSATNLTLPAVQGKLVKLAGSLQAGSKSAMNATLSLSLKDQTLRRIGTEKPQEWPNLTAPITADGDYYLDGQTLAESIIGWSSFHILSSDVRIDLSHSQGEVANAACGGGSASSWVGVHLGKAKVIPYTMELVSASDLTATVNDWAIVDGGICGNLDTGPFNAKVQQGTVHFDSLQAKAQGGTFSAVYKGMKIHVPWLELDLTGDAKLQSGSGKQASLVFPGSQATVTKNYGNLVMKASNLVFGNEENVGWSVNTDTHFDLKAENKPFASFDVPGLFFAMNGRAYFAQGKTATDVSLSGKSTLGQTPLDLQSVHVLAPASGADHLKFNVATLARLSEVMPAADMQVNYAINYAGNAYEGAGPFNSPFSVKVAFPAGQPTIVGTFNPVYGTGSGPRYHGNVDLAMFGGPPVKAEFVLGYQGNSDYWLTRLTYALPGNGVTLVPPVMNLYQLRGGLGHNYPLDTFKQEGPLTSAQPKIDGSFLFYAGMRVGMPDQFTYMLDGDFTVKPTGPGAGARMDFHSWILTTNHSGQGDFQGYLQYTSSSFDGEMWGKLSLLQGAASIEVPKGAASMHFGKGPWHIYFGKKQGPRIKGHLLVADADSYVMLGSEEGLSLGGSESVNLAAGGSIANAYVKGWMDIGLQVTPQPRISGDFGAGCEAGGCLSGACVSMGVNASVHAEAPPVNMRAHACLDMPWPIPDPCINVHL